MMVVYARSVLACLVDLLVPLILVVGFALTISL